MTALALALLLTATPVPVVDAGPDAPRMVIDVRDGVINATNGEEFAVTGGVYLTDPALLDTARALAGLRAQLAVLNAHPPETPAPPLAVIIACVVVMAAGFAGGLAVSHAFPR